MDGENERPTLPSADESALRGESPLPGGSALPGQLRVGQTFAGRYLVVEILGQGGYGSVYRAKDLQLEREVALKLLHSWHGDDQVVDLALREARALARLEHPNVVPVHDVGTVDGTAYLTMSLVRGRSLAALLAHERRVPWQRAVDLAVQLCDALDHAHRTGIVHRDVKPQNVLVDDDDRLHLVDFGIALLRRGEAAREGSPLSGTLGYLAPEVIDGAEPDARSDQFAVGVTLFEMLTGSRPFEGATLDDYRKRLADPAAPLGADLPEGLPRGLAGLVRKAVASDPSERHPSCGALARALTRAVRARSLVRAGALGAVLATLAAVTVAIAWPDPALGLTSQLRGLIQRPDGASIEVALEAGAALTAGDFFWLSDVSVTEPAHVYVMLLDSAGDLALLCPGPGCGTDTPLAAGQVHRLPPSGAPAWQLDEAQGFESVFVLASRQPLRADRLEGLVREAASAVQVAAGPRLRGVRSAPLPVSVEQRAADEQRVLALLTDHVDAVRRFRVTHE